MALNLALLPPELVQSLNEIYFLHLLVNDKDKVVPPGKSVLSMMLQVNSRLPQEDPSHKEADTKHAALLERVQEAAHKAFWKEAAEALSSPIPSEQIPRLRRLYLDLHEALAPLLPPNHRILVTLDAPPPPSSSPLLSTVNFLREILFGLRERCAPVRDEQIDALLLSTSSPPSASQPSNPGSLDKFPSRTPELVISPLAQYVVDKIRAILSLAEEMKGDLNNFVLGSMTEEQVVQVLSSEVESREREFIMKLWGSEQFHMLWQSWVTQTSRRSGVQLVGSQQWIDRLIKGLEAEKPVFCVPPETLSSGINDPLDELTTNNLPPHLFFITPTLIYLQNYLQAIVITASLRLLALPPPTTFKAADIKSQEPDNFDLVFRVWTLLKAEIDADSMINPSFDDTLTTVPETKLINLADEVVRARQNYLPPGIHSLPPDEEKRVRDSVDRTLRTTDPVFLLLKKRLLDAFEDKLFTAFESRAGKEDLSNLSIPEKMRTGRDPASIQSGRTNMQSKTTTGNSALATSMHIEVLGFEHDILRNAMLEVYEKLVGNIVWTERVWGDDLIVSER